MDDAGTRSVRPLVTETAEGFGPSAVQAFRVFQDKTVDICEYALLGANDAFRFSARSLDLGTGVLIDSAMSPMVSRRPGRAR